MVVTEDDDVGNLKLRDAPAALQLYGVVLMLSGTAALAILFALIADMLVSARLARILGGSVPRAIRDHVVVCGLGNIGYRIVEQLVEMGVPVVAAEQQEANRFLPVVRLRVAPGSRAAGRPVGDLERGTRSRVLLLEDGGAPSWRPPGAATVAAGGELVVVVPRGELGTVLAWTEAGVGADRDAMA